MKAISLKIRVLPVGFFLCFGGLGLFTMPVIYVEPHIGTRQGEDLSYVITAVLLFAAASWILAGRKKDLGERISHAAYVILSIIIPLAVGAALVFMYFSSMD